MLAGNKLSARKVSLDVKVKDALEDEESPVKAKKLDMLGSITLKELLKSSRPLKGLREYIPEEARLMEQLRERYGEQVRSLQVKVAGEIREKSFRKAKAHFEERWGTFVGEARKEREDRERRKLKAKMEESGTIAILPEEKNWTHRDRITDDRGGGSSPSAYTAAPSPPS